MLFRSRRATRARREIAGRPAPTAPSLDPRGLPAPRARKARRAIRGRKARRELPRHDLNQGAPPMTLLTVLIIIGIICGIVFIFSRMR